MSLELPSKGLIEEVYQDLGVDEEIVADAVAKLKEWLHLQPHLPNDHDEARLKKLFIQCKGRLEEAKAALDALYTARGKIPEILGNRDPMGTWFRHITETFFIVTLPKYTEDGCRVTISGPIGDVNLDKFDLYGILKVVFMAQDIRYKEDFQKANIFISDMRGGTPAHAARFTLPLLKKLQVCALRGYRARVKQVHLLNASPFMNTVISLGKTLIKQKHRDKLVLHLEASSMGYQSLHRYVDPKILPNEYGGEAGSIYDLWDDWKKKIMSYRKWFVTEGARTSDESKRPGKPKNNDTYRFEGSFRQINLD